MPAHVRSSRGDKSTVFYLIGLLKRDCPQVIRMILEDEQIADDIRQVIEQTQALNINGVLDAAPSLPATIAEKSALILNHPSSYVQCIDF